MKIGDLSALVESWSKEIDEITEIVDEWSKATIEIDIPIEEADDNEKFKRIKKQWEKFAENIQKRMEALRNKIINTLHKIYEAATDKLEPYKTIAEILLSLKPDLGAIVEALKKLGEAILAIYTEAYQTILEIIQVVAKLSILVAKLSSLTVPKVVFKYGQTWQPKLEPMEPITLDDIIQGDTVSGGIDDEDTIA